MKVAFLQGPCRAQRDAQQKATSRTWKPKSWGPAPLAASPAQPGTLLPSRFQDPWPPSLSSAGKPHCIWPCNLTAELGEASPNMLFHPRKGVWNERKRGA